MSKLPLKKIQQKYHSLNEKMATIKDHNELIKLSKEQKKLQAQFELVVKIEKLQQAINQNNQLLKELDSGEEEIKQLTDKDNRDKQEQLKIFQEDLLTYLSPADPRDSENIILEIRAGAGGDESSLFAGELLRMYFIIAQELGFKPKIISSSNNEIGGYKEVIVEIHGQDVYSWYKYEGGVHRVQRVPATEKQGRIHTSTTSVAIMPLIEKNNDFKLDPGDIEIMITMSSGNGGQSVNTTYSAVKMRHKPTGIEAQSQDEKNQIQNREKCLQVLTSRVHDKYEQERLAKEIAVRRDQVGSADRSEKIRTYNFPQDRVTDHRYNQSWNQLPDILNGKILKVIKDIKKLEAQKFLT